MALDDLEKEVSEGIREQLRRRKAEQDALDAESKEGGPGFLSRLALGLASGYAGNEKKTYDGGRIVDDVYDSNAKAKASERERKLKALGGIDDTLKLLLDQYRAKKAAEEAREAKRISLGQQVSEKREKDEAKRREFVDKSTIKLQHDLEPQQNAVSTIENIESKLGFNLHDIDNNGKVRRADGSYASVDLPGVSLPIVGRVSAYSSGARDLDSAMSKLFNVELKTRSGAAVTSPELERLRVEFASGKFNSEPEMLKAMRDYKIALHKAMQATEVAYPTDVVQNYSERPGSILSSRITPPEYTGGATKRVHPGQYNPDGDSLGGQTATAGDGARIQRNKRTGEIRKIYPDGRIEMVK